MPIDVTGFNVPPTPRTESEGLARLNQNMWRNRQWQYQLQREKEQQQWMKAHLINSLTDLSDYKTGSDVADAVGNHLMNNVAQKYLANADNMSPLELEAGVKKDTSGIITGMGGIKDELGVTDKNIALLKQNFPNLDTTALYDVYRKDVVNRHLNETADNFDNPVNIANKKPAIDLTDPNELSKFVKGTENLNKYFSNPQGLDKVDAYSGNRDNYTKFTAKGIPSWREPNYDPDKLSEGLFIPKNITRPALKFKTQTLPIEALPSSQHKPFEMMAEEPYNRISGKEKLELINASRQLMAHYGKDYDKSSPEEKELIQRKLALDIAKDQDKSDFYPSEIKTPSAALLKYYAGNSGKGGEESNIRNIYGEISGKSTSHKGGVVPLVDLSTGAQSIALKQARDLTGDNNLGQDDIYVRNQDGKMMIVKRNENTPNNRVSDKDEVIGEMDFGSTNIPAQVDVKAKRKVVEQSKQTKGKYDNL